MSLPDPNTAPPANGDTVIWRDSSGRDWPPAKVREVFPDQGYCLVEGSNTGLPLDQVTRVEPRAVIWKPPANRDAAIRAIADYLRLVHRGDEVIEIRILDVVDNPKYPPFTMSGYFDQAHLEALGRLALEWTDKALGVYTTINPVLPDLLARAANRLKRSGKDDKATGDAEIVRRSGLVFDADPERPSGVSATDAEKALARERIEALKADLDSRGFPEPIIADSGNGYHLRYEIDLPADDGGLTERVLKGTSARHTDSLVKIDPALFNPSRIIKLYGTRARKGDSTARRPHRRARVISVPSQSELVSREMLEQLASDWLPAPKDTPAANGNGRHSNPNSGSGKGSGIWAMTAGKNGSGAGVSYPEAGITVFDDYDRRACWDDAELVGDWPVDSTRTDGEVYRTRPGKGDGVSASTGYKGKDILHVFTSNAPPFEAGKSYTKTQVYALQHHGGEMAKAARALSDRGFGTWIDEGGEEHSNPPPADWRSKGQQAQVDTPPYSPSANGNGTAHHWPPTPPGKRVQCTDRDPPNYGTVVEDLARARVHFISPSGRENTVVLSKKHLCEPDGSPLGSANVAAGDDSKDIEELEIPDRWPRIDPKAFYGIAGEISLADPHSEADPVATLIQFLVAFGNLIGRRAYFSVGATRHYLNLFVALIGLTAIGRKGTSWDVTRWTLTTADPEWGSSRIQSGLVSGEGLIYHVRDPAWEERETKDKKTGQTSKELACTDKGVEDKRLLAVETEMGRMLKAMNRDTNTLSDVLRQAWDSGSLRTLGKNSPVKATDAHVSIICHATQADIRKHLTETDSANGFANRFTWALSRRSKILPDGGDLDSVDWDPVRRELAVAVAFAKQADHWADDVTPPRRMTRDPIARKAWHEIYEELSAAKPGLVGKILSRAEAQVMRIACLYALLDQSELVRVEHLEASVALWEYCEASARLVFGEGLGDPDTEKLLEALKEAPDGLTRSQIASDVFGKHKKTSELASLLSEMLTQGLIRRTKDESSKGRPAERWLHGGGPK